MDRMSAAILKLFPGCPLEEAQAIAEYTACRGSGRVGRTAAGQSLDEDALTLAVVASIRHRHTRYDQLLMRGCDRLAARDRIRGDVERVLERWRHPSNKETACRSRAAANSQFSVEQ